MRKQGASASEWSGTVTSVVGGRAGGKEASSTGSGTDPGKIDEAVEAATKYLERFTLQS